MSDYNLKLMLFGDFIALIGLFFIFFVALEYYIVKKGGRKYCYHNTGQKCCNFWFYNWFISVYKNIKFPKWNFSL